LVIRYFTTRMMELKLKPEYDDEPIFYCKDCLSLRVRDAGSLNLLYCEDCSNTDIGETTIDKWVQMYEDKYGFNYLTGY
jgi:hypothetical protein